METFSIINPYTNRIIETVNYQTYKLVKELSIELANNQKKWKKESLKSRIALLQMLRDYLEENKDILSTTISTEMGKPINESIKEVKKCIDCCHYYTSNYSLIKKTLHSKKTIKEPVGVVLGIMPWNYPLWQIIRFIIPTLLAGNTCLVKPAPNVYKTAQLLGLFFNSVNLKVCGICIPNEENTSKLIREDTIHGVSLTGSVAAGKAVGKITTEAIKPCVLELGGSDPFIIFDSANIDTAIKHAVQSRFSNCGQTCIAAKRFYIQESIYQETIEKFSEKTKEFITFGDPLDGNTTIGPLSKIDIKNQLNSQLLKSDISDSMIKYKDDSTDTSGNYFPAMIIDGKDISESSPLLTEEIFGPIAICQPFKTTDEAIEKANQTPFGLGASIWTKNEDIQEQCINDIECGTIGINTMVHSKFDLPFGGRKNSGIGLELGMAGILSFTHNKTILKDD